MPSQSSLPLPNGRAGHSPSYLVNSQVHEAYSDEDIELVHDIVALAESLYPNLPERERLPTNALFLAAEQILPHHGYDAENAPSHISRLIFKIGGQRSGETLRDKFKSVLAGMGIRLEFVPSSSPATHPPSVASFARSDNDTRDLDVGFPGPPRRRHSDVSRPSERPSWSDEATYELPVRVRPRPHSRSVSFPDNVAPGHAVAPSRDGRDGDNFWFPRKDNGEHNASAKDTDVQVGACRPVAQNGHIPSLRSSWDLYNNHEDGEPEDATDNNSLQHFRPQVAFKPREARFPPRDGAEVAGSGIDKEQAESPSTVDDTDLIHPYTRSEDGFGAVRGASDTTVQTHDDHLLPFPDGERPIVDVEALEAKLEQLRMHDDRELIKDVFGAWRATACEAQRKNAELKSIAVEYDNNDLLDEVLGIWNEETVAAQQERLRAEAAAKYAAYVAKMERRATRVYEIFTIRNVLAQWQDQAREEVDRTAVARRHLVRKRAFEGWQTQHIEDETKVKNFILKHALQKWSQVTLHQEVRREVAAHWHEQQLCKQSLHAMWEESKELLADEFYASSLVRDCLDGWADKAREIRDEYQMAVALDERLVLDEAVNIWLEEVDNVQDNAYECTRQWLILGCRRDLEYWQEQARLSALLKQFNSKCEEDTKRQVLETWHSVSGEAKRNTTLADAFLLREPVDHWEREMKLKLFIERDEYETKAAVLNRWALEEKLAWYKRHLETRTKRQTLDTLLAATRQARSMRVRHEQEADYVDAYYAQTGVVDTWLAETDKMWKHRQNANLVNLYRTTKPCLDHWRERCNQSLARGAYYRREANRHRNRAVVNDALDKWPAIAETARRERMMNSLRQFRRKYKVELAQECLGKWLEATADAVDAGRDAYDVNLHYRREDVHECLDFWKHTVKRAENIRRIAADAELEFYCGKWEGQLREAQENMQDAVEYDEVRTRARCWERWELHTLEHQGKRHMAATIQEKNERRLCSQILDDWQQKAVPEAAAAHVNPRLSTLSSRRSIRQQLARSSTAGYYTASQLATLPPRESVYRPAPPRAPAPPTYPETPQVPPPVSQLGMMGRIVTGTRRGGAESTRFTTTTTTTRSSSGGPLLGPMAEFDDESLLPDVEPNDPGFMSTPTRWTGNARPLGYRPAAASLNNHPTTTPSAILPSPYERQLRQQYGGVLRPRVGFADIHEESAEDLYG